MRTPTSLSLTLLSFVVLAFPAAAGATTVSDALRGSDSSVVSRGEFVRAAVEVFGLPADNAETVAGQRVPDALLPYVNTALDHDAMDAFRGRWQLGRGITRGEALVVSRDECVRPDSSIEALAKLKPVFRAGGSVTAGNSSGTNDAAAVVALASPQTQENVLANILSWSQVGIPAKRPLFVS